MPEIAPASAVDLMVAQVKRFDLGELLEVDNEVFRMDPFPPDEAQRDRVPVEARLIAYLRSQKALDELVDTWNLIFPGHRNVWYNEEEDTLNYDEKSEEPASWVD